MDQATADGHGPDHRSVTLSRTAHAVFEATNTRGGTITLGTGDDPSFTPVELLLAAIGGCTGIDVDFITSKRAEPINFEVITSGEKTKDANGNRLADLHVAFSVSFPDGPEGDRARAMLPKAIAMSHSRLCTVSRTVYLGTDIATSSTSA